MKILKPFLAGIFVSVSILIFASCGIVDTKECPDRITVSSESECQNYCARGGCDGYVDDATGTACTCY